MPTVEEHLSEHAQRNLDELLELLRIPSISALPQHADDVRRAGQWVADRLTRAGAERVEIMETGGHPVVYADYLHAPGKPTVMIYGHFDVQPVDPLALWTTPPFEPTIRDGRIYARGASDDKGNMLAPIQAAEALLAAEGGLPVNVKFFFEGQEEIGSPQLKEFVERNRDRLACDLVLSSDGGQWSESEPELCIGFKGLSALQINVVGASSDLHSGLYGGAVANPIHALVRILDSMRAPDGKITVDGFFDDVRPLTDDDRQTIARVPFDEAAYKAGVGVEALFGEPGYSTHERAWARPTLELNGIWGGFQGEGTKTVLPNEAHAKITCRLVPDQDPVRIADAIEAHVRRHTPPGVKVTVDRRSNGARPYLMPAEHPGNRAVGEVLAEMYGREPYYTRTGGTIPVCDLFLTSLGAYLVGFAFGLNDEGFHAPNEFFRIDSFRRSHDGYVRVLRRLAKESSETLRQQ
jgi:acetylornithine deacetylase/succinyl-diaminopimelate desuccinylase-like protein